MFTIGKEFRFEASHILKHHKGKCNRMHGHSYKVIVEASAHDIELRGSSRGMVLDFGDLSAVMNPLIKERFDHHHLNDTLDCYPTAENIAQYIHDKLLDNENFRADAKFAVTVWETAKCWARYEN